MSLGHDPILAFIFGVMDVMSGTGTYIDKHGDLRRIRPSMSPEDLIAAFLRVILHLLSDPQVSRVADQQFSLVPIPEDIPELGIEAGYLGSVDHTYPVGGQTHWRLYVEVSRPDGTTIGFTQLETDEEGAWHVMTYDNFG